MSVIGEIIVKIGADASKFNKEIGESVKNMNSAADKLGAIGKKLTLAVTLPIVGIGAASLKMAADAEESENLFEVSMGDMANSARKWSEDISNSLGFNDYAVRKNVSTFNTMFISMGLGKVKALEMSEGLTQLAYDMASFYNLKPEEAFQKLQAGITGEIEPLKRLGIVINETTVQAYAMKHHMAGAGGEMTEQQKIMARYALILESTKQAQGDMARTLGSTTNQARVSKEQLNKLAIEIGKNLTPIAGQFLKILAPILEAFAKLDPTTMRFILILATMAATIGPIITLVSSVIKGISGLTSFMDAFNLTGWKTTAIIVGVVAALIALAAIIAVLTGKTGEVERTFGAISSGVGQVKGQVNGAYNGAYNSSSYQYNGKIPGFATGINRVPEDMVARIHKGEAVIPAQYNPFNPNADSSLGETNNFYGDVVIDAKTVKEFNDVWGFFKYYKMTARQGVHK